MYNIIARIYQTIIKIVNRLLPWKIPEVIKGEGSVKKLPSVIKKEGLNNVLVVSDKGITEIGLMDDFLERLESEQINYTIFNDVTPNPTIENVESGYKIYLKNDCQGIVAFGGGSPMDCGKIIAARVARPRRKVPAMKGLLKVRRRIAPFFAVPTTAGTGSEATVIGVITNKQTNEKYDISDLSLIPHYAVLDPALTVGLPPHLTAETGIDALTHAIEAYIGRSNTEETERYAKKAVKLVFENIYTAYSDGTNIKARENMLHGSFYAGLAFTRAFVGYVHAMAHTVSGFYSTGHGHAISVILPYVLEYYGEAVHKPLSELADVVGIKGATEKEQSDRFIQAIRDLNASMNIPKMLDFIRDEDIPIMIERALDEANPRYPVPKILKYDDIEKLFYQVKGL
ncbi:MAG: iron-containing alcohol dehydrogenase [Bacteroidales bacterium]|nr:iron-containing alcohol dehydrogenase [Bacteroidales bacterium]